MDVVVTERITNPQKLLKFYFCINPETDVQNCIDITILVLKCYCTVTKHCSSLLLLLFYMTTLLILLRYNTFNTKLLLDYLFIYSFNTSLINFYATIRRRSF